ncbi:hypothetical protein BDF20DRAFT_881091 [Mycotypha africana]|uniref:uncharacterized protein n=1 Tax=Mycotypha africana TaxID=64632 RepID=UPI0023004177|nr:uncharacterized protein BDF20DRAFT_881091 [Mycotypha africana]KAI8973222.1 hypothetical protein BDF20DRAFT_881091 [Mycotypha africana]
MTFSLAQAFFFPFEVAFPVFLISNFLFFLVSKLSATLYFFAPFHFQIQSELRKINCFRFFGLMTGNLRWHSCSTDDFPLKRHKVSKACETCRNKKMRCDGKFPCQRCEHNKISCKYNDKPAKMRTTKQRQTLIPTATPSTSSISSCENNKVSIASKTYSANSTVAITATNTTTISTTAIRTTATSEVGSEHEGICIRNDLFETILSDAPQSNTSHNSFSPPLLLDFYNLTARPEDIWTCFSNIFEKFCSLHQHNDYYNSVTVQQMQSKNDLVKEAIKLFVTHNLLYGAFIRAQLLSFVVHSNTMYLYLQKKEEKELFPDNSLFMMDESSSPSQSPESFPFDKKHHQRQQQHQLQHQLQCTSVLLNSILALTFGTAFRQQAFVHDLHKKKLLQSFAFMLYRRARQQFFEQCFSIDAKSSIFSTFGSEYIIQSSILLAQFQCQIMNNPKQTSLMINLGFDLLKQTYLDSPISHASRNAISCGKIKSNNKNEREMHDCMTILSKILDAWRTWLMIYSSTIITALPSFPSELSTTKEADNAQHSGISSNESELLRKTIATKISFAHLSKDQNWALQIVDAYNQFLKAILMRKNNHKLNVNALKPALKEISRMLRINCGSLPSPPEEQNETEGGNSSPYTNYTLQLYHYTLTLQCFLPHINLVKIEEKFLSMNKSIKSRQSSPSTISSDSMLSLSTTSPSVELTEHELQQQQAENDTLTSNFWKNDMHNIGLCVQASSNILQTLDHSSEFLQHDTTLSSTLLSSIFYSVSLIIQFLLTLQTSKELMVRIRQTVMAAQKNQALHYEREEERELAPIAHLFKQLRTMLTTSPPESSRHPFFEALWDRLSHSNWGLIESQYHNLLNQQQKDNNDMHNNTSSLSPSPPLSPKVDSSAVGRRTEQQYIQQHSMPSTSTTTMTIASNTSSANCTSEPVVAGLSNYIPDVGNLMSNDIIVTDCNSASAKVALDHMMSIPPPRADIDKEQLEKLSSHRFPSSTSILNQQLQMQQRQQYQQYQQYQQQQLMLQQQHLKHGLNAFTIHQNNQYAVPPIVSNNSTNYMFDSRYMSGAPTPFPTSPVDGASNTSTSVSNEYYFFPPPSKRSLNSQQLQEYNNYNSLQPHEPSSKRLRSDTLASYEQFMPSTTNQLNVEHANSTASTTDAALMYWMLDGGAGGSSFYQPNTATTTTAAQQQELQQQQLQQQQQHRVNNTKEHAHQQQSMQTTTATSKSNSSLRLLTHQPPPLLEHEPETATTVTVPMINSNANNITKLPLPQPSLKSITMPLKSWSSSAHAPAQTWSKFFFASEVQTLHCQTPPLINFEPSTANTTTTANPTTFPISLRVINEDGQEQLSPTTPDTTTLSTTVSPHHQHQRQHHHHRHKNFTYPTHTSHTTTIFNNNSNNNNRSNNLHPQHNHSQHHHSQHRHSIISDKSSTSSHTSTATNLLHTTTEATPNTVVGASTEAAEAAAAAAAAMWVSTAAAVAASQQRSQQQKQPHQYGHTSNSNSNSTHRYQHNNMNDPYYRSQQHSHYNSNTTSRYVEQQQQQQQKHKVATGHWINSEKVDDDEYWE